MCVRERAKEKTKTRERKKRGGSRDPVDKERELTKWENGKMIGVDSLDFA